MGNKLAVTEGGVHKVGKKAFLTVDGIHRKVKKAFLTVGGVHQLCYSNAIELLPEEWNSGRTGATTTYEVAANQMYGSVSGGSNSSYAGVDFHFYKDGEKVLWPKGTTVTFSFTGTRYNSSCTYQCRVCTDPNDAYNTRIYQLQSQTASKVSYTLTEDAYIYFNCEIGGTSSSSAYATITLTYVAVDGEVFVGA